MNIESQSSDNEPSVDKDAASEPVVEVRPARGVYLLPNAFTTAALFFGFYAIVMAMNLKFDHASIAPVARYRTGFGRRS